MCWDGYAALLVWDFIRSPGQEDAYVVPSVFGGSWGDPELLEHLGELFFWVHIKASILSSGDH